MADFHIDPESNRSVFGKASTKSRKSGVRCASAGISPLCPQCGSKKLWRDGLRYSVFGDKIQRWLCRACGIRFSDPDDVEKSWSAFERLERVETKSLKADATILSTRQICVSETKNLAAEQKIMEVPRRNELLDQKSAVLDFVWQLRRNNYSEDTFVPYGYNLEALIKLGVDLFNPQSFIDKMTELGEKKTNIRKHNLAKAYKCFLNYYQIEAKLPKYKVTRPLPYVPREKFLDQLIACALSDQMSILLQTLKETAARPGEALRLKWDDIDVANKTINISHPEKGCNPRILPISENLVKSLLSLPHAKKDFIFNYKNKHGCSQSFRRMRKRAIAKLGNPELRKIHFYTFRYWRATMEYRKWKDFESVMILLGHNSLRYVLLYKQISKTYDHGGDGYIVKEASNKAEAKALLEDGFDYVMDKGGASLFRNRSIDNMRRCKYVVEVRCRHSCLSECFLCLWNYFRSFLRIFCFCCCLIHCVRVRKVACCV